METKLNYLLNTCILIDFLRGSKSIYDILVSNENLILSMSTVTMMELMLEALNKKEATYIQKVFEKINIIYIDEDISKLAQELIIKYTKSHNLPIDDALIAATSLKNNIELITYYVSDFQYIPNILLYQFPEQ
jgi:predicted nucleic acid-binding protein